MSILIKGMEMPKNCGECCLKVYDGEDYVCPFSWQICLSLGRQNICPLIELPPHGDLIDRDKLETHHGWYNEDRERNVVQTHIQFVYANAILTAPVVVESEE